ncbi:MAG: response regulator [Nitrosopumilus sp.]
MKILIVEDEVDLLEEYKIFLESNDHNVTLEMDGESGLKTYFSDFSIENGSSYDIVILDYQLSGKNGMQVASEILAKNPKQRILFASAYVEDTLKESIKTLKQIVELLQKPFGLQTLLNVIEDTSTYQELEKLNVDIKNLKDLEPTHSQIATYLDIMKKLHDKIE